MVEFISTYMNKFALINIGIILLNPWWWIIIKGDFLVGFLILTLSLLLFIYFFNNGSRILFSAILLLTVVVIVINVKQGFDEKILKISQLDIQKFLKRHEFYGQGLGKIYKNRISISYFKTYQPIVIKLQSNFSENLDLNLYFFANHPRERAGVDEFEKYLPIFLPFFIIGILYLIYKPRHKFITYVIIILIVSSLLSPQYKLGPVLIFPVINYILSIGFILILKYFPKKLKNDFKL